MKIDKNDLGKAQVELKIELTVEEFAPYIKQGAEKVSREVKIDGFRPGHIPLDVLKKKIGEMSILEEAANIAINKTMYQAIKEQVGAIVGQPKVEITKLAPDNPFEYKEIIAVLPEVKLGEYKNLGIKRKEVKVEDKDVEKTLSDLKEMHVKENMVEREIQNGDKAIMDIQMFLDNVPLEGGQSKDTAIIIGKDYIIPGFDKKVLGMKKGEMIEFKLPYPENFHMKNLAGKMVEFKVTAKEIFERKLPELNDELAIAFGLKTIDELKRNIKHSLHHEKEHEAEQKLEREMIEKMLEKTRVSDLPEILVEHEAETMMSELEQTVTQQGANFEDYLAALKKTRDQLMLELLPEAVKRVKVSLMVREVAKEEKIAVNPEEVHQHIEEMKKHYQGQPEITEKISTEEYKQYVTNVLGSRKVIDKLKEWNITK